CSPLMRARLFRLDADEHAFLMTLHHIICDDWSLRLLLDEISEDYAWYVGSPVHDRAAVIRHLNGARFQLQQLSEEDLDRQLAYWRDQLDGAPPLLEIPTDRPRTGVRISRGRVHRFSIPVKAVEALRRLARAERATMFMAGLAAFNVLLARYSQQDDLVV